MADWRLSGHEAYLKNATLKSMSFHDRTVKSDHAHCEFCTDKISEYPDTLHRGYCTEDESRRICKVCFEDFNKLLGFTVK